MNEKTRSRGPTLTERVQLLEKDRVAHAKTISVYNSEISEMKTLLAHTAEDVLSAQRRISAIEEARRLRELSEVRTEEREIARTSAVNARFDHLETQLKAIKENGNKVVWIVLGSVILAIVTFIIKGGLFPS